MNISRRLQTMPVSAVRKLAPLANAAKAEGVEVLHLNIGDPDISTPDAMMKVLTNFDRNPIGYAPSQGLPEFIDALVSYYHSLGHTHISSEDIITTVGGSEAIAMALFGCCDPGDEILVFEPFYSNYKSLSMLSDLTLHAIPTEIGNGFHLPPREVIEQQIKPNTKAILISTPGNPTGTIYTKDEMDLLVEIAEQHNLYIISDEVYREFVFDGTSQATSILSYMERLPDRLILTDSLSKRYSLCGARLGVFLTKNEALRAGAHKIAQSRLSSGLVDQYVGAQLTQVTESYMQTVVAEYERRRDALFEGMSRIPGVTLPKANGAFYTMVKLPVDDAEDFCRYLLETYRSPENKTVMFAPGYGFYLNPEKGRDEVRVAYVLNVMAIQTACDITAKALEEYHSN
ncbi:MAG: pyridoxal phosphate-dependent aminotransferase [Patescibacteria group bacterium]